jgi:hypothetical protein
MYTENPCRKARGGHETAPLDVNNEADRLPGCLPAEAQMYAGAVQEPRHRRTTACQAFDAVPVPPWSGRLPPDINIVKLARPPRQGNYYG